MIAGRDVNLAVGVAELTTVNKQQASKKHMRVVPSINAAHAQSLWREKKGS